MLALPSKGAILGSYAQSWFVARRPCATTLSCGARRRTRLRMQAASTLGSCPSSWTDNDIQKLLMLCSSTRNNNTPTRNPAASHASEWFERSRGLQTAAELHKLQLMHSRKAYEECQSALSRSDNTNARRKHCTC